MIASFVMTFLTNKDRPYLWVFYRFLEMAKKYGWPIIAQEEYFEKPSELKKQGRLEIIDVERVKKQFGYNVPCDEDLEKIVQYKIPKLFIKKLRDEYGSNNDMFVALLKERNKELEEMFESFFCDMEKRENVECVLTITSFPSLEYVAKKHNCKVIKVELGSLRGPLYLDTAFFDERDILGDNSVEERYKRFLGELDNVGERPLLFNRRELLSVLLEDKYLKYVYRMEDAPKYDVGMALGTATWIPYLKNSQMNDEELLWLVSEKYSRESIIMRRHPGDFAGARYPMFEYCLDTSVNTIEFILKCKTIATLGSNISFESKLFGKNTVVYQKSSGYYMAAHDLDEQVVAPKEFLNFFAFGYMVPMEFMTDPNYVRWRLTNPSEIEIFNKHQSFYLTKRGIRRDKINFACSVFTQILEQRKFDFDSKNDFSDIVRPHIPTLSDYKKKVSNLEQIIERMKMESK